MIKTQNLYKDSTLEYFVPSNHNENYVFGGWYTDEACNELFPFEGIVATDLNLYAKWVNISDVNYCELNADIPVMISGNIYQYLAIVLPTNQTITVFSKSGLDLFGGVFNAQLELLASCDDISDENLNFSITVTLEAGQIYFIGYKANQASVLGECYISISGTNEPSTFIIGDYSYVIETINVVFDNAYSLPTPKKDGYVFIGWFAANGNSADQSIWHHETDMTLFAHWEAKDVMTYSV